MKRMVMEEKTQWASKWTGKSYLNIFSLKYDPVSQNLMFIVTY